MPIGLVDDNAFNQELENLVPSKGHRPEKMVPSTDSLSPQILELDRGGRSEGDLNVPDSLRKIIGETSVIEGRQSALGLAGMFGISPASVSAYAKGATSTASYDSPKPSIIQHINKSRKRAIKKAQATLDMALGAITQDKLDYTDARDLSGIAKDMSVIIKNLEPETQSPVDPEVKTPQFVIFAPQFRDERSFEVIQVQE